MKELSYLQTMHKTDDQGKLVYFFKFYTIEITKSVFTGCRKSIF